MGQLLVKHKTLHNGLPKFFAADHGFRDIDHRPVDILLANKVVLWKPTEKKRVEQVNVLV
ncbi:MAG: hypothetical protein ACJ8AH_10780 [Stellaceae bacterium]